ncbi:lipopolysaccharide biosynthesis protein [Romboutsia lituseburensis]|uniref:Membrane protein involved in the export of O-antigen and teichoic acid n=1 Tax=Romboutsia lituseburensis DSM 797 TaxID=1121325 RepID=A0A1G9PIT0_9FIRM|nr:oligosaccharide flippase family protein [Romboutsia lituseburensis]CEH33399.1 Polysaccharide biosynthesis protein [Romboutsia lituseburensis]SDL98453.1 Membrane protein involved in the export of O-antigen and teichoic acid [Romboutsia lituseburensis DSM 797]
MNDNLFKKFTEFAMGNGIVLILGFISAPLITRIIAPEEMGRYSMFNTISNFILLLILLGIDQAYVRFFYEEKIEDRSYLLRQCISLNCKINIMISVVLLIFYKPISKFIIGEYSFKLILLMILFISFSMLGRFSLLVIRMKQKAKIYSALQVLGKVLYIAFILIFLKISKNSCNTLILALVTSNILTVIVSVLIERKDWFTKCNLRTIKTSQKDILKYGSPLFFSMAITWIFQSTDKISLNLLRGYEEVGIYAASYSIVALLNAFQNTFTTFWVPVAHEKYVNENNAKLFFIEINKIVSFTMLILGILLITFKDIIVLLLGSKYSQAVFVFPFLVFNPIMYTISETTVIGIGFMKKSVYHIYVALISAFSNIIGNILLVPQLGAKGAAISTGISYIIFFLMRTSLSKRVYNVNYSLNQFYVSSIMLSILALYSTTHKLDLNTIAISLISTIIILYLYRDVVLMIVNKLRQYNNFIYNKF